MGRVSLHAVSRWSRSPGCCGYISWCVFLVSGGISFFFFRFLYFERTRPTASTRQPCLMYLSTSNEACLCLSVCVTFVAFTDCKCCTRPISTNPVSMEAGEYGLTSGTWFFARRLEVVAVAGLLRLSWCVLDGANFFLNFFFRFFFFFERTPPAASMRPSPLASFTSLLVVVYTW